MLLIALLLAVMLTAIGWYVARDLFAPFVAAPAVWAAAIIVYYVLPAGFYPSNGSSLFRSSYGSAGSL